MFYYGYYIIIVLSDNMVKNMKSIKELSLESKILKRLQSYPTCTEMVNYLFADEELQEMQIGRASCRERV